MIAPILMALTLVIMLCVLAYRLATVALPFMLALEAARFAYATGVGWIGAGIVGFFAGVASFGLLALLFATLRSPFLRLAVALIFAAPAAVAGYALVHGVTREAVPSENLAANLLHRRRFVRRLFGACSAGRSIHVPRASLMPSLSE